MLPLRWTERAVNNLAGIAEFISPTSDVYAEQVVLQFEQRVQMLRRHPLMGKLALEAEDLDVRELVVDSHRVFYRVRSECIELLTIVHGRQSTPRHF
jgi:plasmid stabilization system protein ParE